MARVLVALLGVPFVGLLVLLLGVACDPVPHRGSSQSSYSCYSIDPAYPCPAPPSR